MKSGLVSLLSSEATITAISGTRVYVQRAPQNAAFPHIIITQMSSDENGTLDGGSGQLRFLDFDIDCKAKSSVTAESLGNAVRTYIDDYSGTAGSSTIGAVIMNDESDDYEPPQDGSDVGVFVVTLDVTIHYNT
tara:strand:- start:8217 stop:8618 length:402 start_codon:yes stop_codon:yes gene_type:complete